MVYQYPVRPEAPQEGREYLPEPLSYVQLPPERPAPHIGHAGHLCELAEHGQVSLEQIKALVKDPKFICRKCGRVANRAESLCEPVPL